MGRRRPINRNDLAYALLFAPVASVAMWLAEQHVTTADGWAKWVQSWPDEMLWIGVGVGLCFICLDPFREGSRSRQVWEAWCRSFTCKPWTSPQGVVPTNASDPHRKEVGARLQVTRRLGRGRLTVTANALTGPGRAPQLRLLRAEERTFQRGEVIDLRLAAIPILPNGWQQDVTQAWDAFDRDRKLRWVIGKSNNVVDVTLGGWLRRQSVRFYLSEIDGNLFLHEPEDRRYEV